MQIEKSDLKSILYYDSYNQSINVKNTIIKILLELLNKNDENDFLKGIKSLSKMCYCFSTNSLIEDYFNEDLFNTLLEIQNKNIEYENKDNPMIQIIEFLKNKNETINLKNLKKYIEDLKNLEDLEDKLNKYINKPERNSESEESNPESEVNLFIKEVVREINNTYRDNKNIIMNYLNLNFEDLKQFMNNESNIKKIFIEISKIKNNDLFKEILSYSLFDIYSNYIENSITNLQKIDNFIFYKQGDFIKNIKTFKPSKKDRYINNTLEEKRNFLYMTYKELENEFKYSFQKDKNLLSKLTTNQIKMIDDYGQFLKNNYKKVFSFRNTEHMNKDGDFKKQIGEFSNFNHKVYNMVNSLDEDIKLSLSRFLLYIDHFNEILASILPFDFNYKKFN